VSLFIKLAWRNIFRNKRRTFIAGTAIGIGLAALIFVDALVLGMEKNMVESATSTFLGEAQIHRKSFRLTLDVDKTINRSDTVETMLAHEKIVRYFTSRTLTLAMITSPANVQAVSMVGVNPETERNISDIDEAIQKGKYFEGENERDIIIGSKLAEILEVGLDDRLVLTVSQAHTGELAQELFRVSGIYHFNVRDLDRSFAFVRLKKAQEMLNLGNQVHEIAIKFDNIKLAREKDLPFWKKYSQFGNEAVGWPVILPQLEAAFELSRFSVLVAGIILFGIISLGIINTLFMSLHERMFEFGVLRAVGTRPLSMGELIVFEAGALSVVSIILGMILGFAVTWIVAQSGIDYRGIEFAGTTFRRMLYPILKTYQFIRYPIWVFIFTLIVSLYPARSAAKMRPAEAMRKSF
jgi:ABC-type lipoprotein release transport system permease subunit